MPRKSKQVKPRGNLGNYIRIYLSVLDCQKTDAISGEAFRVWVKLLAMGWQQNGRLPARDKIAYRLRLDRQSTDAAIDELLAAPLLTLEHIDGAQVLSVRNWGQWQSSNSSSRDRMRQLRLRRKSDNQSTDSASDANSDVTVTSRDANSDAMCSPLLSSHVSREEGAIHEKHDDGSGDAPRSVEAHSLDGTLRNDPTEGTYGANVVPLNARRAS